MRIRRLPLFQWLLNWLGAAEQNRLEWSEVRAALEERYPPDQAERQMDLAVDWGRYAEIISYDDDRELLHLEPVGAGSWPGRKDSV